MGNCNKTRKYEQLCCVCIGAMHMYTCTRVQSRFVLLGGGVMVGVQRSKKDQRKIKEAFDGDPGHHSCPDHISALRYFLHGYKVKSPVYKQG